MFDDAAQLRSAWDDALLAAACIAIDPAGLGGVRVRARAGPVRDAWTALWRATLPIDAPVRAVPLGADDGRLFGGLDLAASLAAGRPVAEPGLFAQVDGGYAVLAMAERIEPATAARIAAVLETGETGHAPHTRFGVVAFDEGDDDERVAATLAERLALCVDLRDCSLRDLATIGFARARFDGARTALPQVAVGDDVVDALCATAIAFGIVSLRMPLFALRAARALAALRGRAIVEERDAADAARLVYASRARRLPETLHDAPPDDAPPDESDDGATEDQEPPERSEDDTDMPPEEPSDAPSSERPLDEVVLDATVAAIPADLLKRLAADATRSGMASSRGGGAGALGRGRRRGAPAGMRRGKPRPPERLGLVETLRAAAPWQRIRRAEAAARGGARAGMRVHVRVEDLHVVRFKQRHPTTTVFVVDASGSSALHRLAEAKGAVELLLADCYVRRDEVAVLAFRGKEAQLLLPPTRSLVRARRSLAGLPGGGGTPLASALDATRDLVVALRRRGDTALAVFLTDGRANVARDGSGGRSRAESDTMLAARALRALDVDALVIDTSSQPSPQAARLAEAMGATYRPLPYAGAGEMSAVVNRAVRDRATS